MDEQKTPAEQAGKETTAPRKIWVSAYVTHGTYEKLSRLVEDKLNELASDGYHVFDISYLGVTNCFISAFDAAELGKLHATHMASMNASFAGLFSNMAQR